MLSLLLYLVVLVSVICCSLTVFILCVSKVVQVSNGFSLLDPDVSPGLRIRKWLLIGIASANGARCLSATIEFIIFSIKVVKEDQSTNSISYYDGFHRTIPFTIFISRVFPTILFLACYGIMALYVSELYYSVRELKFSTIRTLWVAVNLLLLVALVQYLLISSNPRVLNIIGLVTVLVYSLWIAWFAYALNKFFFHNEESLSGPSVGQRKVFSRLLVMVCIGLTALLCYVVDYSLDISGAFKSRFDAVHLVAFSFCFLLIIWPLSWLFFSCRTFFCQSSVDLLAILYSEIICAWLIVSLLSNNLVVVESKLLSLVQLATAPSAGGSSLSTAVAPSSAPLLSSHGSSGMKTAQQQQHFKNYQSINFEESLP